LRRVSQPGASVNGASIYHRVYPDGVWPHTAVGTYAPSRSQIGAPTQRYCRYGSVKICPSPPMASILAYFTCHAIWTGCEERCPPWTHEVGALLAKTA